MFNYNIIAFLGITILLIFVLYQVYFYFSYFVVKDSTSKIDTKNNTTFHGKISVIIVAENETYQFKKLLPLILEQDYPNFEVIVVNYGSNDETELIFEDLYSKYSNLYTTFLPSSADKGFRKKKLAITLGAKAAKGDFLIFAEYYTIPKTNQWLSKMASSITDETEIVLGVSNVEQSKSIYNSIARYNNLFYTSEYISASLKNKPYTGTFRNLGLKKDTFFTNKGFAHSLNVPNSEDIFINQIITSNNSIVCLDSDAIVIADYDNYSLWSRIMKNYSLARSLFINYNSATFSIEKIVRVLIYILSIVMIVYCSINKFYIPLITSVLLLMIKILTNYYVVSKNTKLFNNGIFRFSLPFIDMIEALYCLKFKTRKK